MAVVSMGLQPAHAQGTSLTTALANKKCKLNVPANAPNPAVTALHIASGTPCSNVTVGRDDAKKFTAQGPLIPVVVEAGGTLTLRDQSMTLYASSFLIRNGGIMQAGTQKAPIQNQITIVMAGNASASPAPQATGRTPIVKTSNKTSNARDITVMDGGALTLYGAKGLSAKPDGTHNNPATNPAFINTVQGTKSWTYLAVPAGPATYNDAENVSTPVPATAPDSTLTLATTVDWKVKDWVSVATTSFSSHQTEIVQICGIALVPNPEASARTPIPGVPAKVNQLTLCNKLKHYHYGGLAPTPGFFPANTTQSVVSGGSPIDVSFQAKSFYDDHQRNYGIDERAEVALLSRNIKLTSLAGQTLDKNSFIGGHLVATVSHGHGAAAPTLQLVGVEIEKFGQALVGRYPVHLHHLTSGGNTVLIQDVSVHHSYNKCFAVHGTGNAELYNNVCVRTVGQGVYMEDGTNITGNQFMRNFIAGTMAANTTYSYPQQSGSLYWDGDNLQGSHSSANWYTVSGIADTSFSGANAVPPPTGGPLPYGPDLFHPGGFWITNLGNTFVNNSVAGCQAQGRGYWLLGQDLTQNNAYPEFTGNRAHGCFNGLDTAPDAINNASNPYPLLPAHSYTITGATNPPIVITSSTLIPSGLTQPFSVTISGVGTGTNGIWPGTYINSATAPYSFAIENATATGTYTGGGTWQLQTLPIGTTAKATSTSPIVITVPGGIPVPPSNAQVIIAGTGTAADGPWTVTNTNSITANTFSLNGSTTSSNKGFPATGGSWQLQGPITGVTNPPIVITSSKSPPTGTQVTIAGVLGNTAANNTWIVTNTSATAANTFALNGSTGNGAYTSGGTWQVTPQPPVLLLNDNTVTRSRNRGFWGRAVFYTLHNNRFATNPFGVSLAGGGGPEGNYAGYWGLAHENVFAGMTRNNVERYPAGCHFPITNATSTDGSPAHIIISSSSPYSPLKGTQVTINGVRGTTSVNGAWPVKPVSSAQFKIDTPLNYETYTGGGAWQYGTSNAWEAECTDVALGSGASWGNYPTPMAGLAMNIQGYSYYDGPARIQHNRFVNFRFDPTGIYPKASDQAARLLTKTDIWKIAEFDPQGQLHDPSLHNTPSFDGGTTATTKYNGYAGDPATGWIQSNAQTVPPTQYIQDSIWDNVDFKHQVYTEAVNLGAFNDGDKSTVILDKDSQLTGLKVVDSNGHVHRDVVPVSLNNLDFFATDYTVDEPHSRGPNDFRATSLMSPHKYATLNIESAVNPASNFRAEIKRDMPAYGDTVYPSLFLNGRGGNPIYEPFVMDRMGYSVYGKLGTEHEPSTETPTAFMNRLLFSYTDPAVKKSGDYFVNRIAVYQAVKTPASIQVYRIRRQWGQPYINAWPPNYNPPGPPGLTCDGIFSQNQGAAAIRWQDCLARANNQVPPQAYPGSPATYTRGITLQPAADWTSFDQSYQDLLAGKTTVAKFIASQTFYYDSKNNLLYFYMIEDSPVQRMPSPYGTCGGGKQQYATNVALVEQIKSFSDPSSVQAALDASCLVANGDPQPTDLFTCGESGCAAYLVDFSGAEVSSPPPSCSPCAPPHPITRKAYSSPDWNQYTLVYGTPAQQPNGLPVKLNLAIGNTAPPKDNTPLTGIMAPADGTPPPAGDQVTYSFYPLPGGLVSVTENFPYHCVTTLPWSPVNARGAYPPPGGFTHPLLDSVCTMPQAIVNATNASPIVITSPNSPATGTKVIISGVQGNTAANNTTNNPAWTITNTGANAFSLDGSTGNGPYAPSSGTWQLQP